MGGGKTKKPLSTMDKEARKKAKEVREAAKKVKEEKTPRRVGYGVTEQLVERASKVVSESKIVTPSSLASALGIRVSLARAVLRELVRAGRAVIVSKHRGFVLVKAPGAKSR